jgi:hypothetical protein
MFTAHEQQRLLNAGRHKFVKTVLSFPSLKPSVRMAKEMIRRIELGLNYESAKATFDSYPYSIDAAIELNLKKPSHFVGMDALLLIIQKPDADSAEVWDFILNDS